MEQLFAPLLAISGSLRRASLNSAVLRAAAAAAQDDGVRITIDGSVRDLPHFDPDLEAEPPEMAVRFREACTAAPGVLLAVPEYTFGIPGALKNALDWIVGSGSFYRKPVTVLSIAPHGRGGHVREALGLVLTAHGAEIAHRWVPVVAASRNAVGEVTDPEIIEELRVVVAELENRSRSNHTAEAEALLSRAGHNR